MFDRMIYTLIGFISLIITIFSNKWGWIILISALTFLILINIITIISTSMKLRRLDLSELSEEIQCHLKWAPVIVFYPIRTDDIARTLDGMCFIVQIISIIGLFHKFWWGILIGFILYILLKILAHFMNPFIYFNYAKKLNKDYNRKIMYLIEAMKFLYGENPLVIGYFASMGIDISVKKSSEDKLDYKNKSIVIPDLTPLQIAVNQDNIEEVKKTISNEKDINQRDNDGNTCLIIAAMNNNLDIVDLLLKNEADINIVNNKGENALLCIKHPEIVGSVNNKGENTVLCKRYFEIAELLLDCGINIEQKDNEDGNTALLKACLHADYRLVELLIEHNANVNSQNYAGNSAIMNLFINCKDSTNTDDISKILTVLLEYGSIDLNLINKKEENILFFIDEISNENYKKILNYDVIINAVLEKRSDYDKSSVFLTPLTKAIQQGNLKKIKMLIEHGADVNLKTPDGYTPLMFAAKNQANENIIKLLIYSGANYSVKYNTDLEGNCPISNKDIYFVTEFNKEDKKTCRVKEIIDSSISELKYEANQYFEQKKLY